MQACALTPPCTLFAFGSVNAYFKQIRHKRSVTEYGVFFYIICSCVYLHVCAACVPFTILACVFMCGYVDDICAILFILFLALVCMFIAIYTNQVHFISCMCVHVDVICPFLFILFLACVWAFRYLVHTRMHTYAYMHAYTHSYMHSHMYTYIAYLHTYTFIHTCMHSYVHTYTHTCIHTYKHIYMHMCTYLHVCMFVYTHK